MRQKLSYAIFIIIAALGILMAGCTANQNSNAGAGINHTNSQAGAHIPSNNTQAQQAQNMAANNSNAMNATSTANGVMTGIISETGLQYVKSASMYEGNINFILENGSRYTLRKVCIAASNFNLGQCYRINIANETVVRNQHSNSTLLNGCYIPDFSNATMQKVNCPPSLS